MLDQLAVPAQFGQQGSVPALSQYMPSNVCIGLVMV
jgi:hypothetical protein